jgi:DNA-binding CsgD family transcriptional regulator/tetratricopeptide (TPR) repeat protein
VLGDPAILAQTLSWVGNWHVNVDEPFVGQEYQREALAIFQRGDDRHGVATTLDQLGMAYFLCGDLTQAAARGREAATLFRQLDDRQALSSTLGWLCECGGWYGGEAALPGLGPAEAQAYGEESLRLARAIGWRAGQSFALLMLAARLGLQGEYGQALALGREGLALAEEIAHGEWQTEGHFRLGAIHADLLDDDAARDHLERALTLARDLNSRCLERLIAGCLASLCVRYGDYGAARALLDPTLLGPDAPPYTAGQRRLGLALAELAVAEGDPAGALRIIERLTLPEAEGRGGNVIPHLWRVRAAALAALGRGDEASAAIDTARHAAVAQGARALLWQLHADAATLHRRAEDRVAAVAESRALIEEIAANVPDEGLRDQYLVSALARVPVVGGASPASASRANEYPAGLTAREVEVLRLVAQGLTDAEVAGRLFLSPRTVSTHLRSIYGKLGVSSRTAAARLAAEYGLQ